MDTMSEHYAVDVASAVAAVLGSHLAGVYLHGSAVLGGFDAPASHRRPADRGIIRDTTSSMCHRCAATPAGPSSSSRPRR